MIGGTGVGKSSSINALTGKKMAKVGYGSEPKTQKLMGYGAQGYVLWDSPGIGEGVDEDLHHIRSINKLITQNPRYRIKHLLLIIEANKRDFGTVYKVIEEIVNPSYKNHLTFLMNQADQAMKGREWNHDMNGPTPRLFDYLTDQARSTCDRICQNTGINIPKPLFYSATTGYGVDYVHQYLQRLSNEYKKHTD